MVFYNPMTKQIMEHALVSVHLFNLSNEDASCYAKEQVNENIYSCKFIKKYGVKRGNRQKVNERSSGIGRNGGKERIVTKVNERGNSENKTIETIRFFRRLRRIFNWFNWFKR